MLPINTLTPTHSNACMRFWGIMWFFPRFPLRFHVDQLILARCYWCCCCLFDPAGRMMYLPVHSHVLLNFFFCYSNRIKNLYRLKKFFKLSKLEYKLISCSDHNENIFPVHFIRLDKRNCLVFDLIYNSIIRGPYLITRSLKFIRRK